MAEATPQSADVPDSIDQMYAQYVKEALQRLALKEHNKEIAREYQRDYDSLPKPEEGECSVRGCGKPTKYKVMWHIGWNYQPFCKDCFHVFLPTWPEPMQIYNPLTGQFTKGGVRAEDVIQLG